MGFFKDLYHSHQQLKERIHKTRIPLSGRGQKIMGFVYFCIPLIAGKFIYDWTVEQQQKKWKVDERTGEVSMPRSVALRKEENERNAKEARAVLQAVIKDAEEFKNSSSLISK